MVWIHGLVFPRALTLGLVLWEIGIISYQQRRKIGLMKSRVKFEGFGLSTQLSFCVILCSSLSLNHSYA
ncbi:hypothetical protein CsSME_00030091 [Camellia sinensis var. sinensis]